MEIITPQAKRLVHDWDFVFDGGIGLSITVDPTAGDEIAFEPNEIKVNLTPKPSKMNKNTILPKEEHTIFRSKILSIQHREREVLDLTPDQKVQWDKTVQELTTH